MESDTNTQVSVSVISYNSEDTIRECIQSLVRQKTSVEYEVLVVDGGSDDSTIDIVESFDVECRRIEASLGECRNHAISAASGEYIAFIDSDCAAPPYWLEDLVSRLKQCDQKVAGVGGPNTCFDSDPRMAKVIEAMQSTTLASGGSAQSHRYKSGKTVQSIANCNVLYRSDIVTKFQYPNRNIGEDAMFNYQLRQAGYEFKYYDQICVSHHRPATIREHCSKMYQYGMSMAEISVETRSLIRWYSPLPTLGMFTVIGTRSNIYRLLQIFSVLCASVYSAIRTYRKTSDILSILVVMLLPLQYISYGLGFLSGILSTFTYRT